MLVGMLTISIYTAYDASHLSGSLDADSGFAWIVMSDVNFNVQRKLLVWNYQQGGSASASRIRPGASSEVYQFTMPGAASEQFPTATLVSIVPPSDQKQSYGVIAISSFGQLRYWPRLTEPHRCTDATIPLSGDETCAVLRSVPSSGYYVLGTSTGRLILISLQGTHLVMQREIRASSSVLRTVGSWLGFGSKPATTEESLDQLVAIRVTAHSGFSLLWVLKANALNVWLLQPGRPESLILNTNLINDFESSLQEVNEQQFGAQLTLDFAVCDFQVQLASNASKGFMTLLIGSWIPADQAEVLSEDILEQRGEEYHLATYELDVRGSPSGSTTIKQSLVSTSLLPPEVGSTQEYPALNLPTDEPVACVHWSQFAFCAPIGGVVENPNTEILDITRNTTHRIFGTASISDAALFFTPAHGIVKLQTTTFEGDYQPSGEAKRSTVSTNAPAGFMAQASAHDILAEAFHRYMAQSSNQHLSSPAPNYPWSSLVETLWKLDFESAIRSFSEQIADSRPAEDPRWPEYSARLSGGNKGEVDSSYNAMLHTLLCRQIEDKQELHRNYIHFLREVGLWNDISLVAKDALEQISERFACAVQLRAKHNECIQRQQTASGPSPSLAGNFSIFQQAIESSLIASGTSRAQWERAGLSAQDIYYAKVSNVESILAPALAALKAQLSTKLSLEAQCQLITQTNEIFQSVFSSAILTRSQLAPEFFDFEESSLETEFARATVASTPEVEIGAPWTRSYNHLLRDVIRIARQFSEQAQQTKSSKSGSNSRGLGNGFGASAMDIDVDMLNDQLYYLTDALLSDWYQEIVRSEVQEPTAFSQLEEQFGSLRAELLAPFKFIPSQYELGLQLAQKYREFLVIVEICEQQEDPAKLWNYAAEFSQLGFERVVFEFYYVNKQYYKLLTPPRAYWASLRDYLDTTGANTIAWNHLVRIGDYKAAEETFESLARGEINSAANQTTLLSLAKLSQLASGTPISDLNEEREQKLYLRDAQRSIRAILDHTDSDTEPVSAGSLIARLLDAYDGTEDLEPGHSFRLALDLFTNTTWLRTEFENRDLLQTIWHRILTLERWPELADALQRGDIDDEGLQQNVQESVFFSVGMQSRDITDALPVSLFVSVATSIYGDEPAALRLLADAFDLLYRTKGASPPDLSALLKQTTESPEMVTEDAEAGDAGDAE